MNNNRRTRAMSSLSPGREKIYKKISNKSRWIWNIQTHVVTVSLFLGTMVSNHINTSLECLQGPEEENLTWKQFQYIGALR